MERLLKTETVMIWELLLALSLPIWLFVEQLVMLRRKRRRRRDDRRRPAGVRHGRPAVQEAREAGELADDAAAVGLAALRHGAARLRDRARLQPRGPGDGHGDGGCRHRRPLSHERPGAP